MGIGAVGGEARGGAAEGVEAAVRRVVETSLGCSVTSLEPMAGGIGLRRFFRVRTDGDGPTSLVARVEAAEDPGGRPAGLPPEPRLEPLRGFLESHGLPVPRRYGGDDTLGIDLLEDLGPRHLDDAARDADPAFRAALYRRAVDLVPRLQHAPADPAVPAFSRRLDRALLAYKRDLFVHESLPLVLHREPGAAEIEAISAGFAVIAEAVEDAPARLAHRDFQSQNLHVREDGSLAMVDFQGAFLAPPEYDLVCLLRDSYLELDAAQVRAELEHVRPALPDRPPRDDLERRFDLLTLSRKAKDHARFLYAARTRGDRRFLRFLPTTVRALHAAAARAAAREPALAPLAELVLALPETGKETGDPCGR